MPSNISRRDFIKLSLLSIGGFGFRNFRDWLPPEELALIKPSLKVVRVGIRKDEVREEPSLESKIKFVHTRDTLVNVFEELVSPSGPEHNPRWYRVAGGFMHTAHLAPVDTILNAPAASIPEEGEVFKVTVPYTQTYRWSTMYGWEPLYRLYYDSNHWVIGIDEGPDGAPWYIIKDDLLKIDYFVNSTHLARIPASDFGPINPEVENKRIEVSLKNQTVTCYEGDLVVFHTNVSTGIPSLRPTTNGIPTETPRGRFNVSMKTPVRHMGDGRMTNDINAYELPGVPWSVFFTDTGVAFHGTYWHDNYGGRMSHGCVNMRTHEALWLFRWTTPVFNNEPGKWHQNGFGTTIEVF